MPPAASTPVLTVGVTDSGDDGSFPSPDAPAKPMSGSTGSYLQPGASHSVSQKTYRSRYTRLAGLLVGAALLSPGVIQPALRQIRTSLARRGSAGLTLPPQVTEALRRMRVRPDSADHHDVLVVPEPMVVVPVSPPPAPVVFTTPAPMVDNNIAARVPASEAVRGTVPRRKAGGGPLQLFGRLGRALGRIFTGKGRARGR
jgi:hypothetical protein